VRTLNWRRSLRSCGILAFALLFAILFNEKNLEGRLRNRYAHRPLRKGPSYQGIAMKNARGLSHEQLVELVDHVQQVLYLSADAQGPIWNAEKEWDCEAILSIGEAFARVGLMPECETRWQAPDPGDSLSIGPDVTVSLPGSGPNS
jgi:hypothetical protein